jgi:hypothetical protein
VVRTENLLFHTQQLSDGLNYLFTVRARSAARRCARNFVLLEELPEPFLHLQQLDLELSQILLHIFFESLTVLSSPKYVFLLFFLNNSLVELFAELLH